MLKNLVDRGLDLIQPSVLSPWSNPPVEGTAGTDRFGDLIWNGRIANYFTRPRRIQIQVFVQIVQTTLKKTQTICSLVDRGLKLNSDAMLEIILHSFVSSWCYGTGFSDENVREDWKTDFLSCKVVRGKNFLSRFGLQRFSTLMILNG